MNYRRWGKNDLYDERFNIIQDIKEELVTAPTQTILSRAEAKNYIKASSDTTDDSLVDQLIVASTDAIENYLGGLKMYQQTWKQYQQGGCDTIQLMKSPIIGVPTVSYYSDFDTVTATNITYTTYFRAVVDELYHSDGYWDAGREGDGYIIQYDVGIFTASNYTSSNDPRLNTFKTAIGRTLAFLYENREEYITQVSEGNWKVTYDVDKLPVGVTSLLMPYDTGRNIL